MSNKVENVERAAKDMNGRPTTDPCILSGCKEGEWEVIGDKIEDGVRVVTSIKKCLRCERNICVSTQTIRPETTELKQ